MEITTRESRALTAPKRWAEQYKNRIGDPKWADQCAITVKLSKMRKITADRIQALVGNDSWTRKMCDGCGKNDRDIVVNFPQREYAEYDTNICETCVRDAYDLLNK